MARWYFDYLYESKLLPHYLTETYENRDRSISLDKGIETGVLATIHAYLQRQQCDIYTDDEACDTAIYGSFTSNQAGIRRFCISFR